MTNLIVLLYTYSQCFPQNFTKALTLTPTPIIISTTPKNIDIIKISSNYCSNYIVSFEFLLALMQVSAVLIH